MNSLRFLTGPHQLHARPARRTCDSAPLAEEDLFLLVVLAEALGVPDPAAYWSTEMIPALYDDFHVWHTRIGLARSPLEHIGCC